MFCATRGALDRPDPPRGGPAIALRPEPPSQGA